MTKINGYEINRGRGRTGYFGTCFSPEWRSHDEAPFIAFIDPSTIPSAEYELVASRISPNATTIHLGYYDDSRKAAYVAAMYKANPSDVVRQWLNNDKQVDVNFPKELFDLPEYLTLSDAQKLLVGRGIKIASKTSRKPRVFVSIRRDVDAIRKRIDLAVAGLSRIERNPKVRIGIAEALKANEKFYRNVADVASYSDELYRAWSR
jgi:hypothetical protein